MTAAGGSGSPAEQGERLAAVNGLRGLAIASVFVYHLFSRFTEAGARTVAFLGLELPVSALLHNAWMGVNVFFVLSGFVLFLPYARGTRTFAGTSGSRDFYRRRFRRLMPLYYINLLLCAVFVSHPPTGSAEFFSDAFFMATGTFNFVEDLYYPPYNWVLWSLGLEIWFSVVFPTLVRLQQRFGMAALTGGALLLSMAVRVFGERHYAGSFNPLLDPIKDSFVGRLDEFVLGMAACHLFVRRGALRGLIAPIAALLGALLLYLACWTWDLVQLDQLSRSTVPFLYLLTSVGTTLLLLGAVSLKSRLLRFPLTNAPLQLLGKMCYSLYIWHGVLILHLFTAPEQYDAVPLTCNILIILTLSALSYRYIEFGWKRT